MLTRYKRSLCCTYVADRGDHIGKISFTRVVFLYPKFPLLSMRVKLSDRISLWRKGCDRMGHKDDVLMDDAGVARLNQN